MNLKFSICGLFILLIAILTLTYYSQLDGFNNMTAATSISSLKDGQAVRCTIDAKNGNGANGAVYRYTKADGQLHWYPSPPIASSWDPNWGNFIQLPDCSSLTAGTPLEMNKGPLGIQGPQGPVGPQGPAGVGASTASGAKAAIPPQRNDVHPQVTVSDTSYDAITLKQKSDLLTNIQKMFRNELLANRSTDDSIKDTSSSYSDSSSTQQGNEFNKTSQKCDGSSDEDSYHCPKNPNDSCPPIPDMTQYIKKNAIPCGGCSVDY